MEQTVLTPAQKIALELFAASDAVRPLFYLTGGTALAAFYLQHRYSDGLDFLLIAPENLSQKFLKIKYFYATPEPG